MMDDAASEIEDSAIWIIGEYLESILDEVSLYSFIAEYSERRWTFRFWDAIFKIKERRKKKVVRKVRRIVVKSLLCLKNLDDIAVGLSYDDAKFAYAMIGKLIFCYHRPLMSRLAIDYMICYCTDVLLPKQSDPMKDELFRPLIETGEAVFKRLKENDSVIAESQIIDILESFSDSVAMISLPPQIREL